jgi:hypothetical protein
MNDEVQTDTPPSKAQAAELELCRLILLAQADSGAIWDLETGTLPPGIAAAALKWSVARAGASRRPKGAATASLALWRQAIADFRSANGGQDPTVSELAAARRKGKTAAHHAIKRLKELKLF